MQPTKSKQKWPSLLLTPPLRDVSAGLIVQRDCNGSEGELRHTKVAVQLPRHDRHMIRNKQKTKHKMYYWALLGWLISIAIKALATLHMH